MTPAEVRADEPSPAAIHALGAGHRNLTPRATEIPKSHRSVVARQAQARSAVRLRHRLDHARGTANHGNIVARNLRQCVSPERLGHHGAVRDVTELADLGLADRLHLTRPAHREVVQSCGYAGLLSQRRAGHRSQSEW